MNENEFDPTTAAPWCATHQRPYFLCDHPKDQDERCEHGVSLKTHCAECQIPC